MSGKKYRKILGAAILVAVSYTTTQAAYKATSPTKVGNVSGKIVDARQNDRYFASQPIVRVTGETTEFDLFFSYSGKEYIKSEGPEWDFASPYTSDRISYYHFDTDSVSPDAVDADFLIPIGSTTLDDEGETIDEWTHQSVNGGYTRQNVWHSNAGHTIVKYLHPDNDPVIADREQEYYYMYFETWQKDPRILMIGVARRDTEEGDFADDWAVLRKSGSSYFWDSTLPLYFFQDIYPIILPKVARQYDAEEDTAITDTGWYGSTEIHDYIGYVDSPEYVNNWRKSDIGDSDKLGLSPESRVPPVDRQEGAWLYVEDIGYVDEPTIEVKDANGNAAHGLDHGFWGCGQPSAVIVGGVLELYYVDTTRLVYHEGMGEDNEEDRGPGTAYLMRMRFWDENAGEDGLPLSPYGFTWDNDWDVSFDGQAWAETNILKIVRTDQGPYTRLVSHAGPVVYHDPNYLQFYAEYDDLLSRWNVNARTSTSGTSFTDGTNDEKLITIADSLWPAPNQSLGESIRVGVSVSTDWSGHLSMGSNLFVVPRKFYPKVDVPLYDFFNETDNPWHWKSGNDLYAFTATLWNSSGAVAALDEFGVEDEEIADELLYVDLVLRDSPDNDLVVYWFLKQDIWTSGSWVDGIVDVFEGESAKHKPHDTGRTAKGWYINGAVGGGSYLLFDLDGNTTAQWDGDSIATDLDTNGYVASIQIEEPESGEIAIVPIPIEADGKFRRPTSVMKYATIENPAGNAGVYFTGMLEPTRDGGLSPNTKHTRITACWSGTGGTDVCYDKILWGSTGNRITTGVDSDTRLRTYWLPISSSEESNLSTSGWSLVVTIKDGLWYVDPQVSPDGNHHKLTMEIDPF